jgi:hypothetical protein
MTSVGSASRSAVSALAHFPTAIAATLRAGQLRADSKRDCVDRRRRSSSKGRQVRFWSG